MSTESWSIGDSIEKYGISAWGRSFLEVNARGNLVVAPRAGASVDLKNLVDDLRRRGIEPPLLLRFTDLLQARIDHIAGAFHKAIEQYGYRGHYRGVYPVKVNQQRPVVEDIVRLSRKHHLGLEAGSKPELMIVLAHLDDPEALIICNGYKDESYIEMAMVAQKLGRHPIIVIEKPEEIDRVLRVSARTGIRPRLGVRCKLAARGTGRWEDSSGDRAKFGLTAPEVVAAVDQLEAAGFLDCLELLHFHIGSQVSAIRSFKGALREAGRLYVELAGMGAGLKILDVGGGLGVDYDGTRSDMLSSINYTVQEYANDVVWAIQNACDTAGLPHPSIVTESGRAMVAHHAVLIFNVLGSAGPPVAGPRILLEPNDPPQLHELVDTAAAMTARNYQEVWHDALAAREELMSRFNLGLVDLRTRARGERVFWQVLDQIRELIEGLDYVPDELADLAQVLSETYFCNFSVFQSMPDAWAIDHLFPVMPIHRLDERPTKSGVLADITCDSDGKLNRFIGRREVNPTLALHNLNGSPYYLGAFLVGAYQEILGDLHNLFGDTNALVVRIDGEGEYHLEDVQEGDRITDVLGYVAYQRGDLVRKMRRACEKASRKGLMTLEESRWLLKAFQQGLDGYTYLEDPELD